MNERLQVSHKDADTPDELTRWIWDKYVGVPVAGDAWGQEYEHLLDRVRRMDRSSFTKGLHEGANQMKGLQAALSPAPPAQSDECIICHAKRGENVKAHANFETDMPHPFVAGVSPAGTGQGADKELIIEKLAKDMGNLGYCNYAACAQYLSQAFDSGRDSVKGEGR